MISLQPLVLALTYAASATGSQEESRYYTVDYLTPPAGETNMAPPLDRSRPDFADQAFGSKMSKSGRL